MTVGQLAYTSGQARRRGCEAEADKGVKMTPLDKPRDNEQRVDDASLKKLAGGGFFQFPKAMDERIFFTFCGYDDYLKGVLLSKHCNAHMNRTCSYRIKVREGRQANVDFEFADEEVLEFFANWQVQRVIDKNELVGSSIRIVFIGRHKSRFGGHPAKVYDIFIIKNTQEILQNEPRPRKPRTARPGSGRDCGRRARASAKV